MKTKKKKKAISIILVAFILITSLALLVNFRQDKQPEDTSSIPELGTIYFDGVTNDHANDVAVVFKGSIADLENYTVVDASDESVIYYNGSDWALEANTGNTKISHSALVYSEDNSLLGTIEIIVATKILTQSADLASVYSTNTSNTAVTGYYLVVDDIGTEEDEELHTAKPGSGDSYDGGSRFQGVFDGQGHTIRFNIYRRGLFGTVNSSAHIKDAKFIVANSTNTKDRWRHVILGTYIQNSATIENIYATYEEKVSVEQVSGVGLFLSMSQSSVKFINVIVDLSNVEIKPITSALTVLGPAISQYTGSLVAPTCTNYNVIWPHAKWVYLYRSSDGTALCYGVAETDKDYDIEDDTKYNNLITEGSTTVTKKGTNASTLYYKGVFRYDTLAELAGAEGKQIGRFKVTVNGVNWLPEVIAD